MAVLTGSVSFPAWGQKAGPQNVPRAENAPQNGGDFSTSTQPQTKVPARVILVKGAWSSASDSVTPVPEGGSVTNSVFNNPYFRLSYPVPAGWTQK